VTAAPERARSPRLAATPQPRLRSLLPRGYAGFTEATSPRHLVLPASASVSLVVKLADSARCASSAGSPGPPTGFLAQTRAAAEGGERRI
jgi:hypothetical protein